VLKTIRNWRRERILHRATFDDTLWRGVIMRYPFMHALVEDERARLRELAILFLHEKTIAGAAGLAVSEEMRVSIAAQSCMLILNLGLDYYRGWVEVIVYPDEFVAEYDYVDEDGIAHHVREPMSGESWLEGPVILSWADAEGAGDAEGSGHVAPGWAAGKWSAIHLRQTSRRSENEPPAVPLAYVRGPNTVRSTAPRSVVESTL